MLLVLLLLAPGLGLAGPVRPATPTYYAFHGTLHNHTAYSDGQGTPAQAFAAGRSRGLDFMALTDHSETLSDAEWEDTLLQANNNTVPGTFVALGGCEWTNNSEGHVNVYNTIQRPAVSDPGYGYADPVPTLTGLYTWLAGHTEAVAQFNHPTYRNFNSWAYAGWGEGAMQMVEVGCGAGSGYRWSETEYVSALDHGWRVGATLNADTHTMDWGIDNPGRTGLWATELTTAGVLEALQAMRTFATEDTNLQLSLQCDGAWMGGHVLNDRALDCLVYLYDPDGEVASSLALYTNGGALVVSTVPSSNPYTWAVHLDISRDAHYYFARAQQADGQRAVTAPIWAEDLIAPRPTPAVDRE
jgi:hypothetical protein